jgi:hypothetical protein
VELDVLEVDRLLAPAAPLRLEQHLGRRRGITGGEEEGD